MPGVTFLDGGTLSFSLAGQLASHDQLIVVDAAYTGKSPGSVVCYEQEDMEKYMKGNRKSVHEVGLGDLLDMARLAGHYPGRCALIGIEPFSMEWGRLSLRWWRDLFPPQWMPCCGCSIAGIKCA